MANWIKQNFLAIIMSLFSIGIAWGVVVFRVDLIDKRLSNIECQLGVYKIKILASELHNSLPNI